MRSALGLLFAALLATGCATGPKSTKPLRTGYAPVNGLQLYYEVHGKPNGRPPLLLLHGGDPCWETSFAEVLPLLMQNRQVIAFDQAGHGRTADRNAPFTFKASADDAAALLEYLKVAQADWYGYSNGGSIAIEGALRHPKAVRRIVFQSSAWSRGGSPAAFWKSFDKARLADMPAEFKRAYVRTSPHPGRLQSYFDKSVQRMRTFKGWTREQMRSIKAPMLVVIGDSDIVLPAHAAETASLVKGSRLAILPGTDHMRMVHRASLLTPMIEEFLDAPDAITGKK
jgi:pimeloyl-ACP methyl ester carboxylesterase